MKTIEEIYEGLAGEFQRRTGLTAAGSSDLSVRFYAVAAQLYGMECQVEWMKNQCFPQTATGEMLDFHAQMRGIRRHPARKAEGTLRFFAAEERAGAVAIPEGTVCMTAEGIRFLTLAPVTIPQGETQAEVPIQAQEPGQAGNVEADRITFLAVVPVGVVACTNPAPLSGGMEDEDDESLRGRVLATYGRLANGANAAYYEQTAMALPGVAAVTVLPRNRGVGTVDVIVSTQSGMPGEELLAELRETYTRMREIAVDVGVAAPTPLTVELNVRLTPEQGQSFEAVRAQAESAIRGWFDGRLLGKPVLQAELTALVFAVPGVANCTVQIIGGDVHAAVGQLPCLGSLTVEALA